MKDLQIDNAIVKKAWGEEYSVFEYEGLSIWLLRIDPDKKTSLHCHPCKKTGLILLNGTAKISLVEKDFEINGLSKIMLRKGMFHRTHNISDSPIYLLEVETPNDKFDLIRIADDYGRKDKGFENSSFWEPKCKSCLKIDANKYKFLDKNFQKTKLSSAKIRNRDLIIVLDDFLFSCDGKILCEKGEVLTGKIFNFLSGKFATNQNCNIIKIS